jgi:hypothetical protein
MDIAEAQTPSSSPYRLLDSIEARPKPSIWWRSRSANPRLPARPAPAVSTASAAIRTISPHRQPALHLAAVRPRSGHRSAPAAARGQCHKACAPLVPGCARLDRRLINEGARFSPGGAAIPTRTGGLPPERDLPAWLGVAGATRAPQTQESALGQINAGAAPPVALSETRTPCPRVRLRRKPMHREKVHSTFNTLLLAVILTAILTAILVVAMPPKVF